MICVLSVVHAAYGSGSGHAGVRVIPEPRETHVAGEPIAVGDSNALNVVFHYHSELIPELIDAEIQKRLRTTFGVSPVADRPVMTIDFFLGKDAVSTIRPKLADDMSDIGDQGYVLEVLDGTPRRVIVGANATRGIWSAMSTVVQLIEKKDDTFYFPDVKIVDFPAFKERGLLVDLGGQGYMIGPSAFNFEQWKEYIDWMVDRKYSHIFFEIIGSGKLMGNLDMEKNQWIGYPVDLKSYPQLVCRNRPLRTWDAEKEEQVWIKYTAPNVEDEFLGELIDYAKDRGISPHLQIAQDYFTKQLQPVLGIPDRAPEHPESTAFYDKVLHELVTRYSNVDGIAIITIETKRPIITHGPNVMSVIAQRIKTARKIIHGVNPDLEIALLADYIEFMPNEMEQVAYIRDQLPGIRNFYTPHHQPQQKAWNRVWPGGWKYALYTQYAWDYTVYMLPEIIRDEVLRIHADGYRSIVSQAWYHDVFQVNFDALAEYSWNPTTTHANRFMEKDIARLFSEPARKAVKEALSHTRFDRRMDVLSRQIVADKIDRLHKYWDMYTYHEYRVTEPFVTELRDDARQSLVAAKEALVLETSGKSKTLIETILISAERRYHFAESVLNLLDALQAVKQDEWTVAEVKIRSAEVEAKRMVIAARGLGLMYPIAVYDDDFLYKVRDYRKMIASEEKSLKTRRIKSKADTEE